MTRREAFQEAAVLVDQLMLVLLVVLQEAFQEAAVLVDQLMLMLAAVDASVAVPKPVQTAA